MPLITQTPADFKEIGLISHIKHQFWSGPDVRVATYGAFLAAGAGSLAVGLIATGHSVEPLWAVIALSVLSSVAERGRVHLAAHIELSISLLPILFAAVVFGPLAAMVVAAASMVGDLRGDRMKWAIYTLSESVIGACTGLVALQASAMAGQGLGGIAIATTAGAITAQALDAFFASVTLRLRGKGNSSDVLRALGPVVVAAVPLYTPVVAILAYAYREASPWTLPLFLVPALAAQRLFGLYQEQRRLTQDLVSVNDRLERANLSFATALVATLDARDHYTAGHSAAVAIYSRDIAARMGLSPESQRLVHVAGLVHDIGKVGLPPGLLEKGGSLSLAERRQMEQHAVIGERILANVDDYAAIAAVVRHHHERVDGRGYPDGLEGDDIPLLARIIAVADAYNAMTSQRPYRDAMASRVARLRLAQAVESQFDTAVVAAFEAILASAEESYRTAAGAEFTLAAQSPDSESAAAA